MERDNFEKNFLYQYKKKLDFINHGDNVNITINHNTYINKN